MGFLAPIAGPLVSGIGSLVGGIFGGKKANAAQGAAMNNVNEGTNDLRNVFNFAMPTGQNLTGTALTGANRGLDTARTGTAISTEPLSYFRNILSGNRTANLQQFAPEANALQQQDAAQRRQLASMGTARGGGVAGTMQDQKTREMATINNAIFGQRPAAAEEVSQIGQGVTSAGLAETSLRNQQLNEALNYLGLGANAGKAITDTGLSIINGSPGALSPTGQATSAGQAAAKGGMDLAQLIIGKLWPKAKTPTAPAGQPDWGPVAV